MRGNRGADSWVGAGLAGSQKGCSPCYQLRGPHRFSAALLEFPWVSRLTLVDGVDSNLKSFMTTFEICGFIQFSN